MWDENVPPTRLEGSSELWSSWAFSASSLKVQWQTPNLNSDLFGISSARLLGTSRSPSRNVPENTATLSSCGYFQHYLIHNSCLHDNVKETLASMLPRWCRVSPHMTANQKTYSTLYAIAKSCLGIQVGDSFRMAFIEQLCSGWARIEATLFNSSALRNESCLLWCTLHIENRQPRLSLLEEHCGRANFESHWLLISPVSAWSSHHCQLSTRRE